METSPLDLAHLVRKLLLHLRRDSGAVGVDWTRLRAPARDRDKVLLTVTHVWLRRIPSAIHPKHLCRYHPHIANRFAQCWGDRVQIEELVDELMTDRRGQRRGFSERVLMEISRLELFHARSLRPAFEPGQGFSARRWSGVRAPLR